LALPHLQIFKLDFSDLFTTPKPAAWSAVLAYSLVMIFDIGGAMFGLGNLAGVTFEPKVTNTYSLHSPALQVRH
jgi:xanthine/uracil/vitamin C permease (AzgA family)